jgi:hypothetical protein
LDQLAVELKHAWPAISAVPLPEFKEPVVEELSTTGSLRKRIDCSANV